MLNALGEGKNDSDNDMEPEGNDEDSYETISQEDISDDEEMKE